MPRLAVLFSAIRGQLVYDETGVAGAYDVHMTFRPDNAAADVNDARPSFYAALEDQLGLKLTPQQSKRLRPHTCSRVGGAASRGFDTIVPTGRILAAA